MLTSSERAGLAWQRLGRDDYSRESRASTEGRLVYAIGDIHGRYDLLKALLAHIAKDAGSTPDSSPPLLIFLGDYVDRGPCSSEVLEALLWLKRRKLFEVTILRGNHEQSLLDFIEAPVDHAEWLDYGGLETLQSYGVTICSSATSSEIIRARTELLDSMPVAHLDFLKGLPLFFEIGDFAFVHAGIDPSRGLYDQRSRDLLWIRQPFLATRSILPKVIVHGHSWSSEAPQLHEQRIGLDTGAYTTDVLTAARLYDGTVRFLRTV